MANTAQTRMTIYGSYASRCIHLPTGIWKDSQFNIKLKEPLTITILADGSLLIGKAKEKLEAKA